MISPASMWSRIVAWRTGRSAIVSTSAGPARQTARSTALVLIPAVCPRAEKKPIACGSPNWVSTIRVTGSRVIK